MLGCLVTEEVADLKKEVAVAELLVRVIHLYSVATNSTRFFLFQRHHSEVTQSDSAKVFMPERLKQLFFRGKNDDFGEIDLTKMLR